VQYAAQCFREFCGKGEVLLDFGCGAGTSISYFAKHLDLSQSCLIAADVSQKCLDIARGRFGGTASYLHMERDRPDLDRGSAGMVFSSCVFHHIRPEHHVMWLAELHRVTRPGGLILIFEHNPLNPLTRYAVAGCAFDENATLLRAATLEPDHFRLMRIRR
jgi:ubiquinone/menaquinone biosynthesis C-methylase UbiE